MKEEEETSVCICTKQTGADKAGREGKDEALKKESKRKGFVVEEKREEEGRGHKEREETLVGKALPEEGRQLPEGNSLLPSLLATTAE